MPKLNVDRDASKVISKVGASHAGALELDPIPDGRLDRLSVHTVPIVSRGVAPRGLFEFRLIKRAPGAPALETDLFSCINVWVTVNPVLGCYTAFLGYGCVIFTKTY